MDPVTATLLIGGGLSAAGVFGGKKKQQVYDPYADLRAKYKDYATNKIGTSTGYAQNPAFELDQPDVESAVEGTVLGKLRNAPQLGSDIKGISDKYYGAQKEQMQERHVQEVEDTKNMYNRLGLMSSTPGLKAQGDLMRKQGQEFNVLEGDIANQGIDREMQGMQLENDIINSYLQQGQVLGGAQRGYQQYGINTSIADIERMINEEMGYSNQAASILGINPPEVYYKPNIWEKLGNIGTSVLGAGGQMAAAKK